MRFCVQVTTHLDDREIIKVEPTEGLASFGEAQALAQSMAVQMFPEDPMSSRVFRSGHHFYTNLNDLGDPVSIRPIPVSALGEPMVVARHHSFRRDVMPSPSERPPEAA